jgi:DNA-binding MarR family transcriptional regulator
MPSTNRRKAADPLIGEIVGLFHELAFLRGKATASAWMNLRLTLPQFKLLMVILHHEVSTVGCIAEQLGVGESAASYLIDRLVQAGLVERAEDPSDRRKAMIRASPAGKALLEKLSGPRDWLNSQLREIDVEDLAALKKGLDAIVSRLRPAMQRKMMEEQDVGRKERRSGTSGFEK